MDRIVKVTTNPSNYVITVTLADGRTSYFDVEPYLWGDVFAPLKADRERFDAVAISEDRDTVTWPTGADIAPELLLKNLTKA